MGDGANKRAAVVELTDPDYETQDIVRAFLDLVVDFSIDHMVGGEWPNPGVYTCIFARLCQFLDKYECAAVRRQLAVLFIFSLPTLMAGCAASSEELFIMGAIFENVEMCTDAIRLDRPAYPYLLTGGSALAPDSLSQEVKKFIPPMYLHALKAGWDELGPGRSREQWASAFRREMGAA